MQVAAAEHIEFSLPGNRVGLKTTRTPVCGSWKFHKLRPWLCDFEFGKHDTLHTGGESVDCQVGIDKLCLQYALNELLVPHYN